MDPRVKPAGDDDSTLWPLMEKVVDLARGFRADARNFGEIADRRALDRLQGPEMMQQGPLAAGANARNLLQARFPDVAPPPHAMRPDCKPVRFITQPLHEIEYRIPRLELERLALRHEEGLHAGIPIRPLGNGEKRNIVDAERAQYFSRGAELTPAAVDD
jgi:hypothetical protein